MSELTIRDRQALSDYVNAGNKVKYAFFWGHKPNRDGSLGKTCFSQWFELGFEIDGIYYPTAEHFMMAAKARLFKDKDAERQILDATHPGDAKKIGRTVRGFKEGLWYGRRFDLVVAGNLAKFSQNAAAQTFLLSTGDRVLVEASPYDRIWGIGMAATDPDVENPDTWKGLNLLGFALMEVRSQLRSS
jgi:ribA/ribD-fused uncharacterized protein